MDWDRSRAAIVGVVSGLVLVVVGAFAGRPDVAVLGAAPVVAGFWDWRRRPSQPPRVHVEASPDAPAPGTLAVLAQISSPSDAVLVGVRRGLRDIAEVLVAVDGTRALPVTGAHGPDRPAGGRDRRRAGHRARGGERVGGVGALVAHRRWSCRRPARSASSRCRPVCAG